MDQGTTGSELQRYPQAHQQCFIAHSRKATWRKTIINVCQDVLPRFGLTPWYADEHFDTTIPLREKVVTMIANTRYGIYDLSFWESREGRWEMPRNVFIELGMAIALNRPTLLLRHAKNRIRNLTLPLCLQSISDQICEFTGGEKSLRTILEARLPQWLHRTPEQEWRNRFCIFGGFVCSYREVHPQANQWKQTKLQCHISDGNDIDRIDFRDTVERVFERLNDVAFTYLDSYALPLGYNFLLCSHCQSVRSSPFAIYRITPETSADTFIAIGMSIALEKLSGYKIPKILLTTDSSSMPSLLRGYEFVTVQGDWELKKRLQQLLPQVIQQVRQTTWRPQILPFEVSLPSGVIPSEPPQPISEVPQEAIVEGDGNNEEGQESSEQTPERYTQKDYLISFVESDRDWAEWIRWVLETDGYTCFMQVLDAPSVSDRSLDIASILLSTSYSILLLSPEYLSTIEQHSKRELLLSTSRGRQRRLLPIQVKKCDVRQLITDRTIIDLTALNEAPASRRLLSLAKRVGTRTSDLESPTARRPLKITPKPRFPGISLKNKEVARVFIIFAQQDIKLCQQFEKHLKVLKSQNLITFEYDSTTKVTRMKDLDILWHNSYIFLLLISPDLMASDDHYSEILRAIDRHNQGKGIAIPVILRPTDWQDAPFDKFQALPRNAIPITMWKNTDQAFSDVVQGISAVVEELREKL